jgi:hypothetical protein
MKTQCERSLKHAVEYMLYGNGNGSVGSDNLDGDSSFLKQVIGRL